MQLLRNCRYSPYLTRLVRSINIMAESMEKSAHADTETVTTSTEADKGIDREGSDCIPKSKKKKLTKDTVKRPSHFIAVQICNQEIVKNIEKVQQLIVEKNKAFESALISLPTLHLTLALMSLNGKDEELMKRAVEAMESCSSKLNPDLNNDPLVLTIEGLGHWTNGVIFSKVKEGDALNRLRNITTQVRESFANHDIQLTEDSFQPHLTVLKLSKLKGKWNEKKALAKEITESLYEEFTSMHFGTETVSNIQLLSMIDPKDENGYYSCLKSISLNTEAA